MRILIAEDDRATARLISGLIGSWGFDVVTVSDGTAAIDALEQDDIHMAVLDWMLPDVDGPELCRRVRALQRSASPYLILLTSRNAQADVVTGLEAGADEYLVKPIDPGELRARLNAGARIVQLQQLMAGQVRELEAALANIRKLTGLLPICMYCKSIRDDSNYWHRVEAYVGEHSDVTFSHGICPECMPKAMREMGGELSGL